MNINDFIEERKGEWKRLEEISSRIGVRGKTRKLRSDELWELGRLYSATVSDLALIRASGLGSDTENDVLAYLNDLVIRVHGMIYRKPPARGFAVWRFITQGFPATLRECYGYVLVATGLFFLFGAMGFVIGLSEPDFLELLVPEHIMSEVERGDVWFEQLFTTAPQSSSFLMTHNISVTFLMVASGLTFGVGTVYLLALNGVLVGTLAAVCYKHGLSVKFWSFVLPHGCVELTAIFIASAAGLILAHALIDPGPYRRSEFFAHRGRVAARLAMGCVPMLVLAGIIEAFFSPSPLPAWLKFVFAGVLFVLLITFFLLCGRAQEEEAHAREHAASQE